MAKKTFLEDEDLVTLANEVIEEHKLDYLNGISIKYLLVSPNISKTCAGKCIRPNAELKHFGNFDYLIEISNDLFEGLNDDVRKILIYHELLHILITTDKDGNAQYKIADHSVKDFKQIIKKYSIDWFETTIKTTMASIHDFQNNEQDKIKI